MNFIFKLKLLNAMIKYLKTVVIIGMTISILGCEKLAETKWDGGTNNIIEVTSTNDDLSIFQAAVQKAAITESLKSRSPLTVFAPNNDAFTAFFNDLGVNGLDDISLDLLVNVISYHVIDAGIMSTNFFNGYIATFCEGPDYQGVSLLLSAADSKLNATARIIETDVMASNGVIHKIDKVLMPPTIVDILRQNGNFIHILEALDKTQLDTLMAETGPYTFFAPTDAAFAKFFTIKGVTGIADIDSEVLLPILQNHLVFGNIIKSDLGTRTIPTYNGSIEVEIGYYPMINHHANLIGFDLQGYNGVVHVIDDILSPNQ